MSLTFHRIRIRPAGTTRKMHVTRVSLGVCALVGEEHTTRAVYAYGFQMRPAGEQCDNINSLYVAVAFDNLFSQLSRPTSNF